MRLRLPCIVVLSINILLHRFYEEPIPHADSGLQAWGFTGKRQAQPRNWRVRKQFLGAAKEPEKN